MAAQSGASVGAFGPDQDLAADPQAIFRKLKPGPGLAADEVLADQRRRLQGAMIAEVGRSGWKGVRVRSLAGTAGVSTSTFYRHFVDADDCLASTYDVVMASVIERAGESQRRESSWPGAVRAAVASFMDGLTDDPAAARLALVDIFGGGPNARKRIRRGITELERMLAEGFSSAPGRLRPPRHLVAGMAAGMLHLARKTTLADRGEELPDLVEELSGWMLALPDSAVFGLVPRGDGRASASTVRPFSFGLRGESVAAREVGDDRQRLMRAAIRLSASEGVRSMNVARLRAEAGVSRRRFDACFASLDDCFLEAVEATVLDEAARTATAWSLTETEWEPRTCRFVWGLCAQAASDHIRGRIALLGTFAIGRAGLLRREQIVSRTAGELRATVPKQLRPTPTVAEASVAAAWHIAQADAAAGRVRTLPAVAPLLSYVLLAPIVGPRTASAAIQSERSR